MSVEEDTTVTIEIDGQEIQAPQGSMIIEAADKADIVIPRFCYHEKLSVAANCRMCLVDVENARKPTPACATPVTEGMVVRTKSQKALSYQKAVMEFLLINHPLDCPICDQGGECELQDMAMGYGKDVSRYTEGKRAVQDKDIGPLISTDLTRCIHCTRCVRFGREIAGVREMGMVGRGEHSEIGTFLAQSVDSEVSGNVIDLCPVGALTAKPFRYRARPWEMAERPGIAAHDCLGSSIVGHVRRHDLLRVVPGDNPDVNEVWLSDRDRFSYQAISEGTRLTTPMIKRDGEWESASWSDAFDLVTAQLNKIKEEKGAGRIGALANPSATIEELYLLQKLMRTFGSDHVDHRLRTMDFRHQADMPCYPGIDCALADVKDCDAVLLVGANIRVEQPVLHLHLRQAWKHGAQMMAINPSRYRFAFEMAAEQTVGVDHLVVTLAGVVKVLLEESQVELSIMHNLQDLLSSVGVTDEVRQMAKTLLDSERGAVFLGGIALHHPDASTLVNLVDLIKKLADVRGGALTDGANSAGAWIAGAVPHRGAFSEALTTAGLSAGEMLTQEALSAYILLNTEVGLDSAYGVRAIAQMQAADFVVALTPFESEELADYADVLLPIGAFTETSGTYVNVAGNWQQTAAMNGAPGEARPAWKVLRVLSNFLSLDGFEYASTEEVLAEIQQGFEQRKIRSEKFNCPDRLPEALPGYVRLAEVPMYQVDSVVRRAPALQATHEMSRRRFAHISPQIAEEFGVSDGDKLRFRQGEGDIMMAVYVNPRLAQNNVMVAMGLEENLCLADPFGPIEIEKVKS